MKNTFGNNISVTVFGESHGPAIGAVLDGLPAGIPVDDAFIARCMDRRRARGDGLSTGRTEADRVKILSGVYQGHTTGTPITLMIENTNVRSGDYAKTADLLRPGHADFTAYAKYHGWQDARGGGHFSGRLTAGLVAAGAICLSALKNRGVTVCTHLYRCAGVPDTPFAADEPEVLARQVAAVRSRTGFALVNDQVEYAMQQAIRAAGAEGDSVGGILETAILGVPAGVGEPFFDSMESALAHLAFSIPAVKGIEFGVGFEFAQMLGSEANDPLHLEHGQVVTDSNRNGGINGGISNGMPIVFRTVIKPTPSIYKAQHTVDYTNRTNAHLQIQGRHDPCIAPRAAIVQTCTSAIGLCDLLSQQFGPGWLLPEGEHHAL